MTDLRNCSEHGGRVKPDFSNFDAHSGNYATKNRGNMDHSLSSAVDTRLVRQATGTVTTI